MTMVPSPSTNSPSRRDDLILMLLHGGAASPEIAERVVNTFRSETLSEVADWLYEVGEKEAAYLLRTVDIPAGGAR